MKCPNCDKTADFSLIINERTKTARAVAVHKRGHPGPFLVDTILSPRHSQRLLKTLAAECKAATG